MKPTKFTLGQSLASYLFAHVLRRREASDHPRVKLVAGWDPDHKIDLVLPSFVLEINASLTTPASILVAGRDPVQHIDLVLPSFVLENKMPAQ